MKLQWLKGSSTYRQDKLLSVPNSHDVVVVSKDDPLETELLSCSPHVLVVLHEYRCTELYRLILRIVVRVHDRASYKTRVSMREQCRHRREKHTSANVVILLIHIYYDVESESFLGLCDPKRCRRSSSTCAYYSDAIGRCRRRKECVDVNERSLVIV